MEDGTTSRTGDVMGKRVGLLAGLLVLALGSGVVAQEPSPGPGMQEPRFEVPGSGFSLAIPADWRVEVVSESVQASMVSHLPPLVRGLRTWVLYADQPGEEGSCAVADMTREVGLYPCSLIGDDSACVEQVYTLIGDLSGWETSFVDLPAGRAMHRTLAHEDGSVTSDYFITDTVSWFMLSCRVAADPPLDDWRAIAESFAFVPASIGESAARVEVPEGGFALELPADWFVQAGGFDNALEGALRHLAAEHDDDACYVWRWDATKGDDGGWADLAEFADFFVNEYRADAQQLDTTEVILPAGQAVRVGDGIPVKDEDLAAFYPVTDVTRVAYLSTDGVGYYSLTCGGPYPPDDDWLSIAESFEFLPPEE